jgi:hypothetical protein
MLTEENVDADESDQRALSDKVLYSDTGADARHDELADGHSDGTEEEERATAPCFDEVQAREGRGDVDSRSDHRNCERVRDAAALEEGSAVVEDEVDTGELLKSLEETSSCETLAKVAAEAVEVAGLAEAHLVLVVGHDLAELLDNCRVVGRESAESGERLGGPLWLAALDVHARSLGQEKHTEEDDQGPEELDGDGDAVAASVIAVLGGVVDNGGKQKTDGNGKLIGTNDGSADPLLAILAQITMRVLLLADLALTLGAVSDW